MKLRLLVAAGLLTLAACGNDDGMSDNNNNGGNNNNNNNGNNCTPIDPKLSELQAKLFNTPTCNQAAACHGANPQGNLLFSMDAATTFNELTMKMTENRDARGTHPNRVVAMNPGQSFLWAKVTDDNVPGGKMPPGGQLDQCELDAIQGWINAGAPND